MTVRSVLGTWFLNAGRKLGRMFGTQLVVEASNHSLETSMEVPGKEKRAWDPSMYKRGQMYIHGYANPVKPQVNYNEELTDPDTTTLKEKIADEEEHDNAHTQLISSPRYREYMRQDLISQLLNPREQWRLIAFAVIALAVLQVATLVVGLAAAGVL